MTNPASRSPSLALLAVWLLACVALPDGRAFAAQVRIGDAAQPAVFRERYTYAGTFAFNFFRGRRFHLYAHFDGGRGGTPVRYTGRVLDNWDGPADPDDRSDVFPVKIVLDHFGPR